MKNVESIEIGYGEALQFGVSQGTYYKESEQLTESSEMNFIEQLRGYKKTPIHAEELCAEAADLIERQAAQIAHLQMALADTEALEAETSARCLKQAAQIGLMREVLAYVKDACLYSDDDGAIGVTQEPHIDSMAFDDICKALTIQPDDSALRVWLEEPVARLIPVTLPDGDRVWARTFEEYSQESSENNAYRNGPEIPLYSPKGLK